MKPAVSSSFVSPFLGSKPIAVPLALSALIREREARWHMMSRVPKPNPHPAPSTPFYTFVTSPCPILSYLGEWPRLRSADEKVACGVEAQSLKIGPDIILAAVPMEEAVEGSASHWKTQERALLLLDWGLKCKNRSTQTETAINANRDCFDSFMSQRQCSMQVGGGSAMEEYKKVEVSLGTEKAGHLFGWESRKRI